MSDPSEASEERPPFPAEFAVVMGRDPDTHHWMVQVTPKDGPTWRLGAPTLFMVHLVEVLCQMDGRRFWYPVGTFDVLGASFTESRPASEELPGQEPTARGECVNCGGTWPIYDHVAPAPYVMKAVCSHCQRRQLAPVPWYLGDLMRLAAHCRFAALSSPPQEERIGQEKGENGTDADAR